MDFRKTLFAFAWLICLAVPSFAQVYPSTGNVEGQGGALNVVNYASENRFLPTPTPAPTPTPSPSATPIDHVADANARLSLDPATHPTDTFQVIQDDDGLTYTFTGPGADADAGLWVTGAGTTSWNGAYTFNGTDRYELIADAGATRVDGVAGSWSLGQNYVSVGFATYAWQIAVWNIGTGASPAPTVSRNPIASLTNWSP